MTTTDAPWTPVCEQAADVIDRHQPHPDGDGCGCGCGWFSDDRYTHGEHVAQVLANLGLLATTAPDES